MLGVIITLSLIIISVPIAIICYYRLDSDMDLSVVIPLVIGTVGLIGIFIGFFVEMVVSDNYYNNPDHYVEQKVETYDLIPYSSDKDNVDDYYLCFSESTYEMQYMDQNGIAQSINVNNDNVDISYDKNSKSTVTINTKIPEDNFWVSTNFIVIKQEIINYSITIPNKESIYYGIKNIVP